MSPVPGRKYDIDAQITSKPKAEYITDEYFEPELPTAPAVVVGNKSIVEGSDVNQHDLEVAICGHLGIRPSEREEKGFLKKLFK